MVSNVYPTAQKPYSGAAVHLQEIGLRKLGVDISVLFLDREGLGPRVYRDAYSLIKKATRELDVDLVNVQFGGIQALQAVRAVGRRAVVTFHGTDLHGGAPRTLAKLFRYKFNVLCSRWAAKRAGWNIVVSDNLLYSLRGVTNRVSVIPTGVDFDQFKPMDREEALNKLCLNKNKSYVLFCDYCHDPIKRRDLADRSVAYARKILPDVKLLELHRVSHKEVPLYLNASTCLLITSDKEGSPNIVKEALACNVPIVSVDVGDVRMRIKDVRYCEIVPRDAEQIGKMLVKVISERGRTNGRETARKLIENRIVCQKILSIYERVMKEERLEEV